MPSTTKIFFYISAFFSRIALIVYMYLFQLGLMPDEAHYWTWAQKLSFGYYSKPPGIALQIALGALLFGPNELGVRIVSLLLPIFSGILIAAIVKKQTGNESYGYLAATAFILSPLGLFGSLLATTDNPVCFFILATFFADMSITNPLHKATVCGLLLALGALFKWPIYILLLIFFFRTESKYWILMTAIALLGIIPPLIWNISHNFPTFHHASSMLFCTHSSPSSPNPFSLLLGSIALLSPGFFFLALTALKRSFLEKKSLLFIQTALLFSLGIFALSCFRKVQINWIVPGLILFFPLIGTLYHSRQKKILLSSIAISIALQLCVFFLPFFSEDLLQYYPCKQGLSLHEIEKYLLQTGYSPEQDFLFSSRYQTSSLLWFYGPKQKRSYFCNIDHIRQNHFCYLPSMDEEVLGKNGYFVCLLKKEEKEHANAALHTIKKKLRPYFSSIERSWIFPMEGVDNKTNHIILIVKAISYQGMPQNTPYSY